MPEQPNDTGLVQVDFTLKVGEGRLQVSLPVPAAPTTMTGMTPSLQILTSSVVDAVVRQVNAEGFAISCRAGCGACCRQLVPLTLFEADALADWIRSLPADQQAAIEARFSHALRQLADSGILARLDPDLVPHSESLERRQLAVDYLSSGVACPFLENESCGIHPFRPLICREYLVTSPPEFCARLVAGEVTGVPMPVRISQALCTYSQQMTGDKTGWIPLVFLFAWTKQGMSLASAPRATGPELLKTIVQNLETSRQAAAQ